MLICNIKILQEQLKGGGRFQKAIDFLMQERLENQPLGKINLEGDYVYVRVLEYQTLPFEEVKFEAHKQYIDIHYVIKGEEAIWTVNTEKLCNLDEYNTQKDIFHGSPRKTSEISKVILSQGDLAIFYPSDAHAPKGLVVSSMVIKKIVVKIKIEN